MGQVRSIFQNNQQNIKRKRIIIIGASFAGLFLAKKLLCSDSELFEIILIDKNDHFEYICNNSMCMVDPGYFSDIAIHYDRVIQSFRCQNILFKRAKLISVSDKDQLIEVEKINAQNKEAQNETIHYDYLIICTGSSYSQPIKEDYGQIYDIKEREQTWDQIRAQFEKSKSLLVVGGGANGVEMITNLESHYGKSKRLGILTRGPRLLPSMPPQASQLAENYMKSKGIQLYLNTEYSETLKNQLEYDMVIDCKGIRFLGPNDYLNGDLRECIDEKSGQIMVNQYLQVTNVDPQCKDSQKSPKVFPNIFSIGDICKTSLDEEKSIVPIHIMTSILAHNIKILIKNDKLDDLKVLPNAIPRIYFVNFGNSDGVMIWNEFVLRGKQNYYMKQFIEKLNVESLNNKKMYQLLINLQNKGMDVAFWCCRQKLTTCLPCHESKARRRQSKKVLKQ